MTDESDNLTLRYLRRIDEKADRLIEGVGDIKGRLWSVERNVATMQADIVELRHAQDRQGQRLDRIERRLGLMDA